MNVTSARIDIKAAAARAERLLERYAEPLAALHAPAWPERLLELAWRRVIDNSAHDSVCGCSQDAVVSQVLTRYAEAEQIGRGVAAAACGRAACRAAGQIGVVNPSPAERTDVVEVDLDVPAAWDAVELELAGGRRVATQLVAPDTVLRRLRMRARQVPELFARRLHGRELFGHSLDGYSSSATPRRRRSCSSWTTPPRRPTRRRRAPRRGRAAAAAADPRGVGGRRAAATGAGSRRRRRRRWADGRAGVEAAPRRGAGADPVVASRPDARRTGSTSRSATTARSRRRRRRPAGGRGRIVDGGDFGDSYNYGPPAGDRSSRRRPSVVVEAGAAGPDPRQPHRRARYDWPVAVVPTGSGRSAATAAVEVTTTLELRAGEPFVRVAIAFDNPSRDHRVRWHVPLPAPATTRPPRASSPSSSAA